MDKVLIDLKDVTFIIPVKFESEDRIRNAFTSITYLLNNFDTKIIVKEVDSSPKFEDHVLPKIKNYTKADKLKNLLYIYEEGTEIFHRMKIINEMLFLCDTKVVGNYDVDIVLKPETMIKSAKMIVDDGYDVIYPYGFGQYQYAVNSNYDLILSFIENNFDFNILESNCFMKQAHSGHVQFFNRQAYIEGGMENENFISSSPEDQERLYRFTTLGYNVGRIDHYVYHMEHVYDHSQFNTIEGNPNFSANWNLFVWLQTLSKEELKKYYEDQDYLRKYK